ncbi:FAD-dependent oxidoreductase [Occultella gossypii]|uniref:FAD-dependent oxidoreductase n=1 Tax=Occultella gossypii TaxID=2800820 RepID=A0ABS7S8B4_9MICO|nr:FAD-dependent oxidoreductase [Occultella gossypii]MBZ2195428.1 FAD-dependent oxidoreductase [Occultella gossypii]
MLERDFDIVVLGAGASGVPAAIAAAELGQRVVLVDRGPLPGGELIGGLPILGAANSRGEVTVAGIFSRLIERLRDLDGYVGMPFDWRTMWGACFDPELMKLVVVDELRRAGVELRLATQAIDISRSGDGRVRGLTVHDGRDYVDLRADQFIDASGDGWLAERAGAPMEEPPADAVRQPVSLTFRMCAVDYRALVDYVGAHPADVIVAENPIIAESEAEAAGKIAESGLPFVAVGSHREGNKLATAIAQDRMFPTTAFYTWPTSLARSEVGLNVTRIADIDGTRMEEVSRVLPTLTDQVRQASTFLQKEIPGYERASISALAARVGVRETKRIAGEGRLETEDVLGARKLEDGVARGAHHVDIHGAGTYQLRRYIEGGGSYDIPYAAMVPQGVPNVIVAGRCLSSSREANGSARVMGPCIAMGEAAGVAAATARTEGVDRFIDIDPAAIRAGLAARGALVSPDII